MTPQRHTLTPDQVKCTCPFCTAYKQWLEGGQQGAHPVPSQYRRRSRASRLPVIAEELTAADVDENDDWIIEAV